MSVKEDKKVLEKEERELWDAMMGHSVRNLSEGHVSVDIARANKVIEERRKFFAPKPE